MSLAKQVAMYWARRAHKQNAGVISPLSGNAPYGLADPGPEPPEAPLDPPAPPVSNPPDNPPNWPL